MTKKTIFYFFTVTFTLICALVAFSCSEPSSTSDSSGTAATNADVNSGGITEDNKSSAETKQPENKTDMSANEETTGIPHIVIYGIGIRGKNIDDSGNVTANTNNKFAILYNQTEDDVNISNWKIKKSAFNSSKDSDLYKSTFDIPADTIIKGRQYLLLTRDGYNCAMWSGDVSSDIYLEGAGKLDFAITGNHIILVDTNDNVIDRLDFIELTETRQKTWERKYNELYITANTNAAYIFRKNPDTDTNIHYEDFTSQTIGEECILKNSTTVIK